MCSSRQDSDDLLRYRMIEELGPAFGLPGDKIEARSAYVTSHRGVGTPRKLFSMRRKPVWGDPPVLTCCCVKAHELRSHDRSSLTNDTRRARRHRLVGGQHGRVDRPGRDADSGPTPRPTASPVGVGDPLRHTPLSPPKPPGRSGQPQLGGAPSPERTVPSKQTYGQEHQGRHRRRDQGSIRLVHVSRSAWDTTGVLREDPGGIRPAGKNASAQVEGGEGQDKDSHRNEKRSGEHDPCRYCPSLGHANRR
jgi:hypothetical protein